MITLLKVKQYFKHSRLVTSLWDMFHKPQKEQYVSYGSENPDKTFYVIGKNNMIAGAWSLINTVMMHIAYALDHGYIPVVDMKNFTNQYVKPEEQGIVNFWEKFFLQPADYTLDDIKNSKNIILSSSALCPDPKFNTSDGSNIWEDQPKLTLFREIFSKYIRYNDYSRQYLESETEKYLNGNSSVIGVLCRGTDYIVNRPTGHEVQPDPESVLADVKKEFETGKYDAVFLATEDQDILDIFLEEFGERLLFVEQNRFSKKDMKGDALLCRVREKQHPEEDKDIAFLSYFTATYILSKSKCLYTGRNNASKGLLYMPSNYDFIKIYNLGTY